MEELQKFNRRLYSTRETDTVVVSVQHSSGQPDVENPPPLL